MNYMPEVLKMLGVEVGEEFKVPGFATNPYYFDEKYKLINANGEIKNYDVIWLINGKDEIEKLPWKPKDNELYYFVGPSGNVLPNTWCGKGADYYRFNSGNYFHAEEEITPEIKERILREMKGPYENE